MALQQLSGIRLFKVFGITVYLHWSWLVIGLLEIQYGWGHYDSKLWNAAEYLALFAIVLMHEFGHALACRSVGGMAEKIVLWPLGGVAFVSPPPRPGAWLWSIAAGPLVNLVLFPILLPFYLHPHSSALSEFLCNIAEINFGLLVFNLFPIYPLDGGQILRSLLWFVMGPAKSLMTACVIGLIGAASVACYAIWLQFDPNAQTAGSVWIGVMALFGAMQSWAGFKYARQLLSREKTLRRVGVACPTCQMPPPVGPRWMCPNCHAFFDAFDYPISCPGCNSIHQWITCLDCGSQAPYDAWRGMPVQVGATQNS